MIKLKNIIYILLVVAFTFNAFAQVDRSKIPTPAAPRAIKLGEYESFELKNGLKVFVIESHKLPRVSYNLIFDIDPILEGDKIGYLSMVGQMLRRGTETRTKEQIDEETDFMGATLSAGSTDVFASGLSKYNENILKLMTDIIFNPTFPEEELEKIRKQTISELAANKDFPGAISSNLTRSLIYGKDHPYGEIQTEETTNNIVVEDLRAYHKKYFKPNIAYLAIVGDVDLKTTRELIKSYFGSWEKGKIDQPVYDNPVAPEKNSVAIVNRSSSVQSNVSITYPVDFKMASVDRIKARVMNQILGGGSTAKLFANLREDKGYTYGSYSSLSPDELVGEFSAGAEVRNAVTDSSIIEIIYEMNQMKKGEITDEELLLAKNSIAGRFSQSLESPQTVANFALNLARYDLPEDYYETYLQKVQAVTKEDVQIMANKYLKTENAYITVVGKASEIEDQLKQFGELKYYDIYGNEVDPSLSKLPDGLTAEAVFKKYITAIGGQEKIAALKTLKMKMSASVMGQPLEMEGLKMAPNKSILEVKMGGNLMQKQVFDGKKGLTSGMQGQQKVEGKEAEDMAIVSTIVEEIAYLDGEIKSNLASVEVIDDNDAYGVEVTMPSGKKNTRYYDVESGFLLRTTAVLQGPQGEMVLSTDYGEYKEFGGVKFPTIIKQPMNAQMKMDVTVLEILINPELEESIFSIEE
ncbi:MAG: insulinase family protein [Ekhidna sp.]|nr:insulinase family protein [Ekhidna sp.]